MSEHWKPVAEFEGFYEVSDTGQVRSLPRVVKCSVGTGIRLWKGRLLALTPGKRDGYINVHLHANGVGRSDSVHVLVAEAFVPNPLNLPEVNHKNSKRADNRKANLEWTTKSGNAVHGFEHGHRTVAKGSKQWNAKLLTITVKEIREEWATGQLTQRQLAKKYGVGQNSISRIVNHKSRRTNHTGDSI